MGVYCITGAQLKVVQSSDLVMHMLVLYGNTGCKMDLSTGGYTVGVIRKMLPSCAYTPCIEEHNIHAIFRCRLYGPSSKSQNLKELM